MYHICINKDYGYNDTEGGGGGNKRRGARFSRDKSTAKHSNVHLHIHSQKKLIAVDQINGIYDVIMTVV